MVAHAWVAWHDGERFREVDPTNDRLDVDASYLPASVWGVVSLLSRSALTAEEVGPAP